MDKEQQQRKRKMPSSIGIILDGNRRWAKERHLPLLEGHRRGLGTLKESLSWFKEAGIKYVIVYTLSTENWNRSKEEVSYLLDLFRTMLRDELDKMLKEDMRVIFVGDRARFPKNLQELMREAEEKSVNNKPYTLVVGASYGGRAEILNAVDSLIEKGAKVPISEERFAKQLWTADIPDPDLIIRTGGVMRLSNFLPWQSIYSELFFTKTYWPAFSKKEFNAILEEFAARERRYGK